MKTKATRVMNTSALALCTALGLNACGAGGGAGGAGTGPTANRADCISGIPQVCDAIYPPNNSGTTTPVASSAEGVYEGTVSTGAVVNTLVLENGQYYAIYGTSTSSGFFVSGFVQGNGQSNNGSFSSTNLKDFFANGTVQSGSLSASYSPGGSINGSVTEGTTTFTFTGGSLNSSSYNYNTVANLADVTGSWSLTDMSGAAVTLTVAANGSFTTSSGGCSASGTVAPRASGKNVFDVALTFGTAPCRLPGQSATGIAVDYILTNGKRELLFAGVDTPRNNGYVVFGSR